MQKADFEHKLEKAAKQVQECVDQNARVAQNQAEYEQRYNELINKYDSIKAQLDELTTAIADKKARKAEIELFMRNLKTQDRTISEFDEELWISMVECVMVYGKKDVRVKFKNGIVV